MTFDQKTEAFGRLLTIMDELRAGCPWDKKQTFQSLRNLTIEETYELVDELLEENLDGIKEEVGDVMLHLVFYAKIADEQKAWDIGDALNAVCDKLIHRHPHIYGDVKVEDEAEVKRNWEQLKLQEKGKKSLLGGVPKSLPALVKAYRMQQKTKQVGFEWETKEQVWAKVVEEIEEFQAAEKTKDFDQMEDEFGDILFSMVNYARFVGIDPETALARTNQKFKTRFEYIEANAGRPLTELTLEEMDILWNQAKKKSTQK